MKSSAVFGKKVKARRKELKMTQQQLADALGFASRSSINKIEIGRSDLPLPKLKQLAEILNIDPLELIDAVKVEKNPRLMVLFNLPSPSEYAVMKINERLKQLRKENKLTIEQVANGCGTSKQNISRYETNTVANIPYERIVQLANFFHVHPGYLMGWTDNKNGEPNDEDIITPFETSESEKAIILALRRHPELEPAIRRMLEV